MKLVAKQNKLAKSTDFGKKANKLNFSDNRHAKSSKFKIVT